MDYAEFGEEKRVCIPSVVNAAFTPRCPVQSARNFTCNDIIRLLFYIPSNNNNLALVSGEKKKKKPFLAP